jgi:flagellum-specific peptidoglycan hydrolase FlgJ
MIHQYNTEVDVLSYIYQLNIAHPDIVYAQFILESGHFKSPVFISNNNLAGMRPVQSRPTTQTGSLNGYGTYTDWQSSVIDYAIWQSWSAKKLTREQYIAFLDDNYAADSLYTKKILSIISQNQKLFYTFTN